MFKAILKEENSLSNIVFNKLKKAIFSGRLKPGERLVESTLAAQFGVSPIPLREAIRRLEAEKLVEVIPYKGAKVVKTSPQDIEDMYTIVGILEGYAAALAVSGLEASHLEKLNKLHGQMQEKELKTDGKNWLKVNKAFHRVFLDACQRPNLTELIYEKIGPLGRYWYIAISIPGVMDEGIQGHGRMIEAFENRNAEMARQLVENHRILTGQAVRRHIENIEIV